MADKKLTEEEVADLKEAFAMFDINGDGKLFFIAIAMTVSAASSSDRDGNNIISGLQRFGIPYGIYSNVEITCPSILWLEIILFGYYHHHQQSSTLLLTNSFCFLD
jgi:hypothetical protein